MNRRRKRKKAKVRKLKLDRVLQERCWTILKRAAGVEPDPVDCWSHFNDFTYRSCCADPIITAESIRDAYEYFSKLTDEAIQRIIGNLAGMNWEVPLTVQIENRSALRSPCNWLPVIQEPCSIVMNDVGQTDRSVKEKR